MDQDISYVLEGIDWRKFASLKEEVIRKYEANKDVIDYVYNNPVIAYDEVSIGPMIKAWNFPIFIRGFIKSVLFLFILYKHLKFSFFFFNFI